jgi:ABC-type glutathione transport system ATPase component
VAAAAAAAVGVGEWVQTPATDGEDNYEEEEGEETKQEASSKDLELGFPSGAVEAAEQAAKGFGVTPPPSLGYRRSQGQGGMGGCDVVSGGGGSSSGVGQPVPSGNYVSSGNGGRSRSNSGGSSALAVEPLTLTFEDVCYSVTRKKKGEAETVDLLQGITGYVAPGTMVALMGASGAGKTTLLDVSLYVYICVL